MAILKKGITGGIKGSIGQVVGYSQKGKSIIRSKKLAPSKSLKELPRLNGNNIVTIAAYLKVLKPFINQILNLRRPDVVYDWNTIVSSLLANSDLNMGAGLRPMSLGNSQMLSPLNFSRIIFANPSFLYLGATGFVQLKKLHPDLIYYMQRIDSLTGVQILFSDVPNTDHELFFFPSAPYSSGDFNLAAMWAESAADGVKTNISFSGQVYF